MKFQRKFLRCILHLYDFKILTLHGYQLLCSHFPIFVKHEKLFLSADSLSSALLVVSSKEGEGEGGREGELFDKFFVAFVFPLKPGILALNQVVSLEASTWTQN